MTNDEERQQTLEHFYRLLVERQKVFVTAEQWRKKVIHFNRLKAKYRSMPNTKRKWTPQQLERKLEAARIMSLRSQEAVMEFFAETNQELSDLRCKLFASLMFGEHGAVTGVWFPNKQHHDGTIVKMEQIQEIVDQLEASKALTKILEEDSKS